MEPSTNTKKKWIVLGIIIAILAIFVALGPVIVAKYMRSSKSMQNTITSSTAEFMIKVKGVIKKDTGKELIYLKGDNDLYYILVGDKLEQLKENLNKKATIFGNILAPENLQEGTEDTTINGNKIRMKISVVNFEL
ncbi:MAG: hypothetical protein LBS29_05860 [Endomicrobium sp.]|jgi:hypothetical protein|uniref:hypothetical protein n=1 Tax=Candidatus Endomicrobiellum cubanum TaxID=3242325 RepID=UPI00281A6C25|nr:hypothetical protein [Endomicrobium sp.]MDR2395519.1 hypothetical protein [Endomicrobium sp.]